MATLTDLIDTHLNNLSALMDLFATSIGWKDNDTLVSVSQSLKTSVEALNLLYQSQGIEVMAISQDTLNKLIGEAQDARNSVAMIETLKGQLAESQAGQQAAQETVQAAQETIQKLTNALGAEQSAHAADLEAASQKLADANQKLTESNQKLADAVAQTASLTQQIQIEDDAITKIQSALEGTPDAAPVPSTDTAVDEPAA
jgi:DNA repair exonuclease SbcCD ATPase subunit